MLWTLGLTLLTAAWVGLGWTRSLGVPNALGVVIVLAMIQIVLEFLLSKRTRGPTRSEFQPRFSDLPDGQVGLASVSNAQAVQIAETAPFLRFDRLEPTAHNLPIKRGPGPYLHPPMRGKVVLVSVFLGRDGRVWTDREIAEAHRALNRAAEWIERQALQWNVPTHIDLCETYFSVRDELFSAPLPLNTDVLSRPLSQADLQELDFTDERSLVDGFARLSTAAPQVGFQDAPHWITQINASLDTDHVVWLVHHRCAGTPNAIAADQTKIPGITLAHCYAREEPVERPYSGPVVSDPVTFVHETLHLFGAEDKYSRPLTSFPVGSVSERDIMYLGTNSLSRLRVDPLTAHELGWAAEFNLAASPFAQEKRRFAR